MSFPTEQLVKTKNKIYLSLSENKNKSFGYIYRGYLFNSYDPNISKLTSLLNYCNFSYNKSMHYAVKILEY